MKTKEMSRVVNFHIALSWCETLEKWRMMNQAYKEIITEYADVDWSFETAESIQAFLENTKDAVNLSSYSKAKRYFIEEVMEELKSKERNYEE